MTQKDDGSTKVVHANMLKQYFNREKVVWEKEDDADKQNFQCWEGASNPIYNPETVNLEDSLSLVQKEEVPQELNKHRSVFSSLPGRAEGGSTLHKYSAG